ncbi:MAG TPA: LysM peptidoglycan-binding domain-containing protein, partial [Bellilinea sp.]|nr:LysM peptidoglycan-binding domain-containing protein [Bellilinea sp.]
MKIASRGKRLGALIVLLAWVFSTIACSQGYVSDYDLTATAMFADDKPLATFTAVPGVTALAPQALIAPDASMQVAIASALPLITPVSPIETPVPAQTDQPQPPVAPTPAVLAPEGMVLYTTQAGDSLASVAAHFGVSQEEISSLERFDPSGFLPIGKILVIPNTLTNFGPGEGIVPDSEVVYTTTALDFDIAGYIQSTAGYLSTYKEYLAEGWLDAAAIIRKVSIDNATNPRLLIALIEYQSGWVRGIPATQTRIDYPLGYLHTDRKGLYKQLTWAAQTMEAGYYGWRGGSLATLGFREGSKVRIAPSLNAGSVAVQYLFSKMYSPNDWLNTISGQSSFTQLYAELFGNPWLRAQTVEPLIPPGTAQPELQLPFQRNIRWSFTGGPHGAWARDGARAALDFAPPAAAKGCTLSNEWVVSPASGVIARTGVGIVVLDLDGDGNEWTGWNILMLHVAEFERVVVGTQVNAGDKIGHPSCEGGISTGTHVHIARKYNGEWVLADGPIPFTLDGYV